MRKEEEEEDQVALGKGNRILYSCALLESEEEKFWTILLKKLCESCDSNHNLNLDRDLSPDLNHRVTFGSKLDRG